MRKTFAMLLAAVLVAVPAAAQEEESDRPGVVAFSLWKCPFGNLSEAVEISNAERGDVYDAMVEEGMIQGWGVLTHLWGDEWNLVFYTLAEDAQAAIEASSEFFRRIGEVDPEGEITQRFFELCPTHKDNIMSFQYRDDGNEDEG